MQALIVGGPRNGQWMPVDPEHLKPAIVMYRGGAEDGRYLRETYVGRWVVVPGRDDVFAYVRDGVSDGFALNLVRESLRQGASECPSTPA